MLDIIFEEGEVIEAITLFFNHEIISIRLQSGSQLFTSQILNLINFYIIFRKNSSLQHAY